MQMKLVDYNVDAEQVIVKTGVKDIAFGSVADVA